MKNKLICLCVFVGMTVGGLVWALSMLEHVKKSVGV